MALATVGKAAPASDGGATPSLAAPGSGRLLFPPDDSFWFEINRSLMEISIAEGGGPHCQPVRVGSPSPAPSILSKKHLWRNNENTITNARLGQLAPRALLVGTDLKGPK